MKKAPKMTAADELYLKKFMAARAHKDVTRIEDSIIADKQYYDPDSDKKPPNGLQIQPDGKVNVTIDINQRLFLERNKQFKPE